MKEIRSIPVCKHETPFIVHENNNLKHQMGTQKYDINTLKHQIDAAKHITTLKQRNGDDNFGAIPPRHRTRKP